MNHDNAMVTINDLVQAAATNGSFNRYHLAALVFRIQSQWQLQEGFLNQRLTSPEIASIKWYLDLLTRRVTFAPEVQKELDTYRRALKPSAVTFFDGRDDPLGFAFVEYALEYLGDWMDAVATRLRPNRTLNPSGPTDPPYFGGGQDESWRRWGIVKNLAFHPNDPKARSDYDAARNKLTGGVARSPAVRSMAGGRIAISR